MGPVRALGAAVVAALLVTAAVIGQLLGPARPGIPVAAPVPAAPSIGDCLGGDPFAGRVETEVPSAPAAPCGQPHRGEVVGVAGDAATFPTMIIDQLSVPDPRGCSGAAAVALGLAPAADAARPWVLRDVAPVDVIGPDARQAAAGQRWVACVSHSSGESWSGSLAERFATGSLPAGFGSCLSDLADSCGSPHAGQTFADVELTYAMPGPDLLIARCAGLVRALTRMTDPTAGGRLGLVVAVVHYDRAGYPHPGYPTDRSQPATATCGLRVTGPGRLVATLLGLGPRPLPWAT